MITPHISQHTIEHINLLLNVFLVIGVIACSISGALRAIDSKMDLTGALLLAFVISNAGGTFRDLILAAPVFWIKDNYYVWLSLTIGALTYMLFYYAPQLLANRRLNQLLLITDAIGLGVFCIAGVEKSFIMEQPAGIAVIMGIWTAVGGGIIADVIANRVPLVFSSELYITVSLCGAILYIILSLFMFHALAGFIAVIFMVAFRMLSVKFHWKLPIINS
ncbi:MAG: trimeric intracellular cation channel family protein [Burkholderiales bacterium]|nr:trimeric intracellular cation channel family protein [Burkholderiales bacterium]